MALPDEILACVFAALAFTPDEAAARLTGRLGRAAVNSAPAPAGWARAKFPRGSPRKSYLRTTYPNHWRLGGLDGSARVCFLYRRVSLRPAARLRAFLAVFHMHLLGAVSEADLFGVIDADPGTLRAQLRNDTQLCNDTLVFQGGSVRVARWAVGAFGQWDAGHYDGILLAAATKSIDMVRYVESLKRPGTAAADDWVHYAIASHPVAYNTAVVAWAEAWVEAALAGRQV